MAENKKSTVIKSLDRNIFSSSGLIVKEFPYLEQFLQLQYPFLPLNLVLMSSTDLLHSKKATLSA